MNKFMDKKRRPSLVQKTLARFNIAAKLNLIVGLLFVILLGFFMISVVCVEILSGVRAYVGGEALWLKAQTDAVYHLTRYATFRNESDYHAYLRDLTVPLADTKARLELEKPDTNYETVYQALIEGGNHPDDVWILAQLFKKLRHAAPIDRAIQVWAEADLSLAEIMKTGDELHREISSPAISEEKIQQLHKKIEATNARLTTLAEDFAATLGESARWAKSLLLKILVLITLAFLALGTLVAVVVSRHLCNQIQQLRAAALSLAEGDFSQKLEIESQDEIGDLSRVFGQVATQRAAAEARLSELASDLARSNEELEQFAYVASHDLHEPLRMITGYMNLLANCYQGKLDKDADEFIAYASDGATRMRGLINDLLTYSRVGTEGKEKSPIDCQVMLKDVLTALSVAIEESRAVVKYDPLPTVMGDAIQLGQLFQNLIGNGIKYRDSRPPEIHISCRREGQQWVFSVKDNGIGIDPKYAERIFVIFQRLHAREEYPGTGIGLALCKKIVERHGGKIWVESKLGEGATFHFTIPTRG